MDAGNSNLRSPLRALAARIFRFLLAVYAGLLAMLVMFESKLVYPVPPRSTVENVPADVESVRFESADGTKIHGWFQQRPSAGQALIYFHGNGEDVDGCWDEIAELAESLEVSAFVFDYRGYGLSEGKPHQVGIVADGIAAMQWVTQKTGLPPGQIILVGRSIGSGVAAQVAAVHPPRALVMLSGFTSLVDVAASKYPIFPVRWVMRNRYDSVSALSNAAFPVLQVHGAFDQIIPIEFGRRLFEKIPTTHKHFYEMPERGHNNFGWPDYLQELKQFLDDVQGPK